MKREKENGKNKKLLSLLLLLVSFGIVIVGAVSYFSDYITGTGTATAGTLNLSSEEGFEVYVNGVLSATTSIENLNPGDVVVIKGVFKNDGNKSAWLRTAIDFTSTNANKFPDFNYIKVYQGSYADYTALEADSSKVEVVLTANKASSAPVVINGTGTGKEEETNVSAGGTVPNATTIIASGAAYTSEYTIYFDKAATNAYQGKVLDFSVRAEAMQYRNNATPTWTPLEQIAP